MLSVGHIVCGPCGNRDIMKAQGCIKAGFFKKDQASGFFWPFLAFIGQTGQTLPKILPKRANS